jgi:hypothetical protein
MNRRKFISGLGKYGLTAGTAAVITSTVTRGRDLAGQSVEGMSSQIGILKKRLDSLEGNQKKMLRFLCIFTALSVGVDISLFM